MRDLKCIREHGTRLEIQERFLLRVFPDLQRGNGLVRSLLATSLDSMPHLYDKGGIRRRVLRLQTAASVNNSVSRCVVLLGGSSCAPAHPLLRECWAKRHYCSEDVQDWAGYHEGIWRSGRLLKYIEIYMQYVHARAAAICNGVREITGWLGSGNCARDKATN